MKNACHNFQEDKVSSLKFLICPTTAQKPKIFNLLLLFKDKKNPSNIYFSNPVTVICWHY